MKSKDLKQHNNRGIYLGLCSIHYSSTATYSSGHERAFWKSTKKPWHIPYCIHILFSTYYVQRWACVLIVRIYKKECYVLGLYELINKLFSTVHMYIWGNYLMHFLYGFQFCFLKCTGCVLLRFEEPVLSRQACPHVPGHKYLRWAFIVLLFFLKLDLYGVCSAYTSFLNCRLQFTGCSSSIAQLNSVELKMKIQITMLVAAVWDPT